MNTFKMILAAGLLATTAGLAHAERGEPGDNQWVLQNAPAAQTQATEGRNATFLRPATDARRDATVQAPAATTAPTADYGYTGGDR